MGFKGSGADEPLFISAHILNIIIMILMRDALASGAYISFQEEKNAALWKKEGKMLPVIELEFASQIKEMHYFRFEFPGAPVDLHFHKIYQQSAFL
jgi:hypothetical protein